MRAIKTVDPEDPEDKAAKKSEKKEKKAEKKEKRQAKRAHRKAERALNPFNQPPKNSEDNFGDGLSGSCEAGNLKACKTEVKVMPKFNPNKGVISNSRKVGSKRQREKQAKKDENARLKAETGKTKVGRALSKIFSKKPKPKQRRHANTRFL